MAEQSKERMITFQIFPMHLHFLIVVSQFSNLFHNCDYPPLLSKEVKVFGFTSKILYQVEEMYISTLYGGN